MLTPFYSHCYSHIFWSPQGGILGE